MYHFFIADGQVHGSEIEILGADVNHICNVLRMKPGEVILVSDSQGMEYTCEITRLDREHVIAQIMDVQNQSHELPVEITLYQGLPKADKLELIIQKAVELGAVRIVPVSMRRSIVKLDSKKEEAKQKRWNSIAQSAAKQSKRSIIPKVSKVLTYAQAWQEAIELDYVLVPYELAEGMEGTRQVLSRLRPNTKIGIFIGPEGGFDESEIELAREQGAKIISLGRRILRTETAGMAAISMLTYVLDE